MTNTQSILTGAFVIAAILFLVNAIHPATAAGNGPFQLMHHSNTQANAGVFRLDTSTGEVSYCYLSGSNGAEIVCSRPIRP